MNNPEQIKIQGTVRGEATFFAVLEAIIDDRLQRCDALYLMTLFAKNERANISKAERNELADLVDVLVQIWLET